MKSIIAVVIFALIAFFHFSTSAKAQAIPNVMQYGALCDGTTDDSAAFNSALAANKTVFVPPTALGCVVNSIAIPANTTLLGAGPGSIVIAKAGSGEAFLLSSNYPIVRDLTIRMNGATYGILSWNVAHPIVDHVYFTGAATGGALIFACDHGTGGGANPESLYNHFSNSGQNSLMGLGELFEGCANFRAVGNDFEDVGGFPEESLWSTGVWDHIRTHSPDLGSTQTAATMQTSFTFVTAEQQCTRFALLINQVPVYIDGSVYTSSHNGTYSSFTFGTPPQPAGSKIRFVCYRQLESFSVNSGSGLTTLDPQNTSAAQGIAIIAPDIDGSGDAGISLAADWHWTGTTWTQIAGSGPNDLPGHITITSPIIRNTLNAAIESYSGTRGLDVSGYNLTNFGQLNQNNNVLSAGIVLSYIYPAPDQAAAIGAGTIDNSSSYAQSGISVNGTAQSDAGLSSKQISISGEPNFVGTFNSGNFNFRVNTTLNQLINSVTIVPRKQVLYAANPDWDTVVSGGKPANTAWWNYAVVGAGVTSSSSIKQGGNNSIQTIAGSYLDETPTSEGPTTSAFSGKIVRLTFWAKSSGACITTTCSYVSLFSRVGSNFPGITVPITSTVWQQYEIDTSFQGAQYLYSLRVGAPAGGITANLQALQISTLSLN